MPIKLNWLIPNKILQSHWSGRVTAHDMRTLVRELGSLLKDADRPIHTIIDLSETRQISSEAVLIYMDSSIPTHPHRGRIAVIGSSSHREVLADLVNRVSQREMICLFQTHDEAYEFLLRHDTPPPPIDKPEHVGANR